MHYAVLRKDARGNGSPSWPKLITPLAAEKPEGVNYAEHSLRFE